jgi:GT2 family glycosyltransferase
LKESGELRDSDKLGQAELAYRRALSLDPSVADSHLQLGHVLKLQGKIEEAQSAYLRAFALDSSLDSASIELAQLGWSKVHFSELREILGEDTARPLLPANVNGPSPEDLAVQIACEQPAERQEDDLINHSSLENDPSRTEERSNVGGTSVSAVEAEEVQLLSKSGLFNASWYLEKYPDARSAGVDSLRHYLRFGAAEGRDPNRLFDSDWYLANNPDVAAAGLNPLVHYARSGAAEGRAPHPLLATPGGLTMSLDTAPSGINPLAYYLSSHTWEGCTPFTAVDGALVEAKMQLREQASREMSAFLEEGDLLQLPAAVEPAVSILLVLYNQAELTFRCLRALIETVDVPAEIIIIDNASADTTWRLLDRLDGARIVRNASNLNFLLAVNQGAAEARGAALLLLNNDANVMPGGLGFALETLHSAADIGAVGGKLILPDGTLQEAGSIIWNNGACTGYGRGQNPHAPEYQFRREVDYCSGAFLLVRRDLFERLGRFDVAFAPLYYEETDFCMRLRKAGYRVVYDPRVEVLHFEFGSSSHSEQALALMQRNHKLFFERHRQVLEENHLPPGSSELTARISDRSRPRVLLIDDRVPFPSYGAGHPRASCILRALHNAGCFVTYYPMDAAVAWSEVYTEFPREIEFIVGHGRAGFHAFLEARAGYYQTIVVSRPHNMALFLEEHSAHPERYKGISIVYDAEAMFSPREAKRLELAGTPLGTAEQEARLRGEFDLARTAQAVIAVSTRDADVFKEAGLRNVHALGHSLSPEPIAADFEDRQDFLFVGALNDDDVPNVDALFWFIDEVMPLLDRLLGNRYRVRVAGRTGANRLRGFVNPRVEILGRLADLTEHYRRARVFIAPNRFAAGIPHKIHETAARGLPAVATSLLATQLGWEDGVELLVADSPQDFANQCARLYTDRALWQGLREAALIKVATDCDPAGFDRALAAVLRSVGVGALETKPAVICDHAGEHVVGRNRSETDSFGAPHYRTNDAALITKSMLPQGQKPDLSIIMPTFNRGSLMESSIVEYLRCIKKTNAELIVIDDGSTDDTPERLHRLSRTHSNVIVDRVQNSGPARARNLASSMARGEILVFVGDDVQPIDEHFLAFHLSAHRRYPNKNEAVLGKIVWPNHKNFPVNPVMFHIQGDGGQQFPYNKMQPYCEYDWRFFFSSNVSVKRNLVEDWINEGYDTSFVYAAFEDPEFALRVTKRYQAEGTDFRIFYVPAATLAHFHPYTVESFLQRQVTAGMMANRLLEIHPERAADIGLAELIGRLNDNSDSSNLPIEHYLSIFEGIKSWAIVLEHHYGLGSQNWHTELLRTIFELAYFEGYIRSKADAGLNYAGACRFVLESVQSNLNRAIFTELFGDAVRPALV